MATHDTMPTRTLLTQACASEHHGDCKPVVMGREWRTGRWVTWRCACDCHRAAFRAARRQDATV